MFVIILRHIWRYCAVPNRTLCFMRKLFRELSFKYLPPKTNAQYAVNSMKVPRDPSTKSLISGQKVPTALLYEMVATISVLLQFSYCSIVLLHLSKSVYSFTLLCISVAINIEKGYIVSCWKLLKSKTDL